MLEYKAIEECQSQSDNFQKVQDEEKTPELKPPSEKEEKKKKVKSVNSFSSIDSVSRGYNELQM